MWCEAVAGAALIYTAYPPLSLAVLAILGIRFWAAWVVRQRIEAADYWFLFGCGAALWLGLLQGIRLAYWPLYAGWIALSLYVAAYVPLFVAVSRVLVHRYRVPLVVAAPAVWMSLELVRCYALTGFGGCLLGHTFARYPQSLQLAPHFGGYVVSGWIVLVGCVLFELTRSDRRSLEDHDAKRRWLSVGLGGTLAVAMLSISWWIYHRRLDVESREGRELLTAALIQENADTRFEFNERRAIAKWQRYINVTSATARQHDKINLVVWPESTLTPVLPHISWDGNQIPGRAIQYLGGDLLVANDFIRKSSRSDFENLWRLRTVSRGGKWEDTPTDEPGPALLLGGTVLDVTKTDANYHNSAIYFPPDKGAQVEYYHKRQLVMFGEYVPFFDRDSQIYTHLGMLHLTPGQQWKSFDLNGVRIAPSICFEDMVPQLIGDQVRTLSAKGESPDLLVNLTNDGWFRGSSMLEHHFRCAIFAAVENRRPMLIAANTGISGAIHGSGQVPAESEVFEVEGLVVKPLADSRWGLWQAIGDWPLRVVTAIIALAVAVDFLRRWYRERFGHRSAAILPQGAS